MRARATNLACLLSAQRAGVIWLSIGAFVVSPVTAEPLRFPPNRLSHADGCRASLRRVSTEEGRGIEVAYELVDGGWANLSSPLGSIVDTRPVTFIFRTSVACTLELKFADAAGGTFGRRISITPQEGGFCRITIYPREAEYWWGGAGSRQRAVSFDIAISGFTGAGTLTILNPMIGKIGAESSFGPPTDGKSAGERTAANGGTPLLRAPYYGPLLDPDREMAGYGTRQRRAEKMLPEDPLVLEWLMQVQDTGTTDRRILPSTPGGDEGHTFNNVLAAMAFIRHGERERAERILDFFRDAATDRNNEEPFRQSFYLNGEARGFFQRVSIHGRDGVAPMHAPPEADRWMGDMAWMLLACLDHQRTFGSDRYDELTGQIADLLRSWYIDDPGGRGGYVQHGWRRGDTRLHEARGHHEGNIDCYAVFSLLGDSQRAEQIRTWLEAELAGRNDLPLDLYTWRVLAYDGRQAELLDVPDFDLRYRKRVEFRGREIVGPYSSPAADVENVWLEGAAHLACAYSTAGNHARANFYANQLDAAIIDQRIDESPSRSLPYTLNRNGDYAWVNPDEGFTSTAAWYILAKHRFNPLRLESASSTDED